MRLPFRGWVLAAAVCVTGTLRGQASRPAEPRPEVPAERTADSGRDPYATEPVVLEKKDTVYRYNADGTGTRVDTQVARVQNDAGVRGSSVLNVPYLTSTQRLEVVYVRVRKRGGAVVETPPGEAQDQPAEVTQAAPLYSDLHVLRIAVRGLGVGDRLEFQLRTVLTGALAKGEFWGTESMGHGRVILERTVELRVPASRHVLVSSPGRPAQTSQDGADKVYRWTGSQLQPTAGSKRTGTVARATEPNRDEADDDGAMISWTTFPSWTAVGDWYRGLMLARIAATPAIKAKADAVTYGDATADARARALYHFVSSSVRSIDVPLGAGRYAPQAADEVLANQYGDSQDKHALLAAMLRAEGLPVSTVLVGTRSKADEDVPAPGWFDRVITLTHDRTHGDVWLDTMPEIAPYGMLEGSLRDKIALVIPEKGPAVLRHTPAEAPFPEFTRFEAAGTLNEQGTLTAHVDLTMRGGEELNYRQGLRNVGPAQWDRVTAFYAHRAGFPGDPSNTVADQPDRTDTPLHLGYDYNREGYADWENFRILPLEPGLDLPFTERKSARVNVIDLGGIHTATAVSRITLPPGFSADLPPAVHVKAPFATLDKTYRLEKAGDAQALVTERTLVVTAGEVAPADWAVYRKFLDEVAKSDPVVQLTSTVAHTGPGHYAPAPGENNPEAGELVQEADEALTAKDWTAAGAKLDQAKAINARQPLLWSTYGLLAQRTGKQEEAIADFQRELKEHPAEGEEGRQLARLLVGNGRSGDAVTTLRAALAANPQDEESARVLAELLSRTDPPAAEKTLRDGLATMPDNLALKLALGEVLLRENKRDEAAALLSAVASTSQDPAQLNDAAYALAGAGLNLRVAEDASRRALQMLNFQAARGPNGLASNADLRRTAQLVAGWDTYGWVLVQEGSYSEAEPWLRAAWVDSLGASPGMHLAKLLQKQGRGAEASHVLALTDQGDRGVGDDTTQLSKAPGPPGMHRTSARAVQAGSKAGLEAERTFPVPRGGVGANGSAVFELDLSLALPPVARFVSGDEDLADLTDAVARVNTRTMMPPGSIAHLLRRGIVTCGTGPTCSLRLLSPWAALSQ